MENILEIKGLSKLYPGVLALDHVSMSVRRGEIHALIGENGAGKSTLIKVVAGAIGMTEGSVIVDGTEYTELTPATAKKAGISVIYQEFNLVPTMTVAENIFLGDRIDGSMTVNYKEMNRKAEEVIRELGISISPRTTVETLSTAQQQIVEIAKAISGDAKILILDEPTAALSVAEVEHLFEIIGRLKEKGITMIYVSHRLEELFRISDRVTVLRDGKFIVTEDINQMNRRKLISLMVGRELTETYPAHTNEIGGPVLEIDHVTGNGVRDISFSLRKGEILGLGGLVGAGRTELAKVIYGAVPLESGVIRVEGKEAKIRQPSDAIRLGIGLIPEDRKTEGAFLDNEIDWNISIMNMKAVSNGMLIQNRRVNETAKKFADVLRIKTPTLRQFVRNLSGGNQQKVVVAKTLAANTRIIIFDEPTRGIDVGAKQEIYNLMMDLVEQGMSILMISSDMEELLGVSDRIVVLHEGRMTGEIKKEEFSQDLVMQLASGFGR